LSLQLKDDVANTYMSAVFFYAMFAILFVIFELMTSASFGSFLYSPLSSSQSTQTGYYISIVGIVFTFPLVASYAVFLNQDKIYLQPVINVVYTAIVIVILAYFYFSDDFEISRFALLLLIATAARFWVATFLVRRITSEGIFQLKFHENYKFYTEMLFSGLAVGLLVAVPFVFRGFLPLFGDGVYSTSALVFKVNDMVLALILVPVSSIVLNKYDVTIKWIFALLALATILPAVLISSYFLILLVFPAVQPTLIAHGYNTAVIELSFWTFLVTCLSYVLGMIQIKLGNRILLLLFSLLLMVSVRLPSFSLEDHDLGSYFYNMYASYTVFIILSLGYIAITMAKLIKVNN